MNPHNRADQAFENWLVDGPTRMPEHLVDSIVTQLEQTHQRKHSWLPGRDQMNRMMLAVGGVAAVALLAVIGLNFVGHGPGTGVQPTPTATPVLSLSPTAISAPEALPSTGAVLPGRYFVDEFGFRYVFTVAGAQWVANNTGQGDHDVLVSYAFDQPDQAVLWLWGPLVSPDSDLSTDPCQWQSTRFVPGPSVDDYATALTTLHTWQISQPQPVTVGGYSGKRVIMTVPADAGYFGNCNNGEFHLNQGRWMQGAGQVEDMRILDFGGARFLVATNFMPGAPTDVRDQLDEMVNSMEIAPAPASPSSTP